MTKTQFHQLAQAALKAILALPDVVFERTQPTQRLAFHCPDGTIETIVLAIESNNREKVEGPADAEDAYSYGNIMHRLVRYEQALTKIAEDADLESAAAIAAEALGRDVD